jgi:hypothetical protein
MANGKQSKARRMKMAERAALQMALHFPGTPEEWLWHRSTNDGYSTIPRTLPIAMQVIDDQTKGQPAGHTLFCLWARSPDHPLITIENPATFAGEAGFTGVRAVDTWRRKMKELHKLGFILPKAGTSGDFHYVLLLNPNAAIEYLNHSGKVQAGVYARFLDRLAEVGAMGEREALHAYWVAETKRKEEMEMEMAAAASPVPPPPPPAETEPQQSVPGTFSTSTPA